MGVSALMDNLAVCKALGVKPDTWRKRVDRGQAPLPFTRQGARSYYRKADIRHFLKTATWPHTMRFRARRSGGDVEAGHALDQPAGENVAISPLGLGEGGVVEASADDLQRHARV